MAAKEVSFSTDARERMLRGVDISNAVKITLGPKNRNVQSYGAPRTIKNGVTVAKEIGSESARMFAARQLGASATPVPPKGNCNEQF